MGVAGFEPAFPFGKDPHNQALRPDRQGCMYAHRVVSLIEDEITSGVFLIVPTTIASAVPPHPRVYVLWTQPQCLETLNSKCVSLQLSMPVFRTLALLPGVLVYPFHEAL